MAKPGMVIKSTSPELTERACQPRPMTSIISPDDHEGGVSAVDHGLPLEPEGNQSTLQKELKFATFTYGDVGDQLLLHFFTLLRTSLRYS